MFGLMLKSAHKRIVAKLRFELACERFKHSRKPNKNLEDFIDPDE